MTLLVSIYLFVILLSLMMDSIQALASLSSSLPSPSGSKINNNKNNNIEQKSNIQNDELLFTVSDLYRYPVKGLSGNNLNTVQLTSNCNRFPDDRKYALLEIKNNNNNNNEDNTDTNNNDKQNNWNEYEWLHKENFLCSFTDPELLSKYYSTYETNIIYNEGTKKEYISNVLVLYNKETNEKIIGPINMETKNGRNELSNYFTNISGKQITCITSKNGDFQFGNTSSSYKQGDKTAQTIHVVFQCTVDALSKKSNKHINAIRFRPNIILQSSNMKPFGEFNLIGKTLQSLSSGLSLKVINKTVRCKGVSIDPTDTQYNMIDIPRLLIDNFPEHGPYLGVYCTVEHEGSLSNGDVLTIKVVETNE